MVNTVKIKKLTKIIIILILLIIGPFLIFSGIKIYSNYAHQNYYNEIHDKYAEIAEDYVKKQYGDHYKIVSSNGVYSGTAIIGDAFQGIDFIFADTENKENNFNIQVGYGDNSEIIKSDNYSLRNH